MSGNQHDGNVKQRLEERADSEAIKSYCEVLVPIAYTFPLPRRFCAISLHSVCSLAL